jgi:arylsulfatase
MGAPLNILLIVADGVRADHLSCYGYGRATTPVLDRLAREGVRFTNMFSSAPSTLAAHASLFTGLHAVSHGATSEHPRLMVAAEPLAAKVRSAGYRTAAFSTNAWVSPEYGFAAGFDAFFTQRYHSPLANRAVAFGRRTADRLLRRTDGGARRTNAALSRWLASGDRPFFAFVHFNETHLPVLAPPPFERLFINGTEDLERARTVNAELVSDTREIAEAERRLLVGLYDGALHYVDQRIGDLSEALRIAGVWDNTLVIVTSDHGESFGEHGVVGHRGGLYDEVLHVPLIMRSPERVPSGFVVDELSQTTDILPTVLEMIGVDGGAPCSGSRPLLRDGRVLPGPEFVVSERFRRVTTASGEDDAAAVRTKAIRTRRDKFIWRSDEANELYDLTSDPREQRNLIETSTHRADALRRQLFDWLAEVEAFDISTDAYERDSAVGESRA